MPCKGGLRANENGLIISALFAETLLVDQTVPPRRTAILGAFGVTILAQAFKHAAAVNREPVAPLLRQLD